LAGVILTKYGQLVKTKSFKSNVFRDKMGKVKELYHYLNNKGGI
jgi:hypothetical protein